MKPFKTLVVLIAALAVTAFADPSQAGREDLLHLSLMSGNVQVKTEDTGDWVPASVNMPLRVGDRLWVPAGARAEIMMRNGSTLRLDQLSVLDIDALDVDNTDVYLEMGRLYANFRAAREDSLGVDTPGVSVRAQGRAVFRVDLPDGSEFSDVAVLKGSVTVQTKQEIRRVDEGLQYSLRNGKYPDITSIFPPDEWERWNRGRDAVFASNESGRYLPEEIRPYGPSLDPYGAWVFVPAYGYCWRPRVAVSWAPYRNGRWCWMGGNYVWLSYDPWGYAPHHYGRWHFATTHGWVWLPPAATAVHWGPGYVGWAVSGAHVAWVPLGPRDVYHGHNGYRGGYAGSAWATGQAPIHKTVYQNIHVHNAVHVVHNETFIGGRHVEVRGKENPFLHQNVVARPEFRPEQAAKMPAIRHVANHEKPPVRVRDLPRRSREVGKYHAGLRSNPETEKQVRQEQKGPGADRRDLRDGKAQQPAGAVRPEVRQPLPGQAVGKDAVAGGQDKRLQSRVEQRQIERVSYPARHHVVKTEEIRVSKETPRHYTNEDLKRFERARATDEAAGGKSLERVANPAPSGEKSLNLAPAFQKKESPAAPPDKKQAIHFGGTPAKEAQRPNPLKNDSFQIIGQGRERQAREPMRPAETRPAHREVRRADQPVQQGPTETHRQPVKEERKVVVKPQAPARTQQAGAGQEATRADSAKAGNAVKAATPAPKAQSSAGHPEGGVPGQAGKIGGFGMR
jgi:hypothetical protein